MTEPALLGIDIGTSATKMVLAQPDGTIIAQTRRPHMVSLPRPGWAEFDAGDGLLAAIGVGLVAPGTDWTRPARIISPAEESRAAYEALYRPYSEFCVATADIVHQLQEHTR